MRKARAPRLVGQGFAVAFALAVSVLGLWALLRPTPDPVQLVVPNPRPALLDRPHRHQFARPVAGALSPRQP